MLDLESARVAGDGALAARTLDQLIKAFPDDEDAYNIAFQLYEPVSGLIHDPQKLLIVAAQGAAAMPKSTLTRNLYAYALLFMGRHEEAVSQFENNVQMAGRQANPHDSLGEAYLVTGRPATAVESYRRALAIDPAFAGSHLGLGWGFGMLGRFDDALAQQPPLGVKAFLLSRVGRYREASRLMEDAQREAERGGNVEEQGQLLLVSAQLLLERGDYRRAVQDCDEAERLFRRLPKARQRVRLALFHIIKGLSLARAMKLDEARTQLDAASRLFNPAVEPENWWYRALEGEIALAAGDLAEAAARFSSGLPARKMWFETLRMSLTILANNLPSRDGLGRVARAEGNPARAVRIYRQLLSFGPEQKFVSVFEPRYVLKTARLLEQAGDGRSAVQEYKRFLVFWAHADADLPETTEARRAIARLSAHDQPAELE